jgi:hypothetical protein
MKRFARFACPLVILTLCARPGPVAADWQDALIQIDSERSKITVCIAELQKHGTAAQQKESAEIYRRAKAEFDEALDAMVAALDGKAQAPERDKVAAYLSASIAQRIAFCRLAEAAAPKDGQKQIFQDVYNDTLKPTLDAAFTVIGLGKADAARRRTVKTQLEASRWPDVAPASR